MKSGKKAVPNLNTKELQLETALHSTSQALSLYKSRLAALAKGNSELQDQLKCQETDAIEVLGALRKQCDAKDREIVRLLKLVDFERETVDREKKKLIAPHEQKIKDLNGKIEDQERKISMLEEEVGAIKDFKKKRVELNEEISAKKAQIEEMGQKFKDTLMRVERKFFEEKLRMQKETSARIAELASKAHAQAVSTLNDTTKEIYRENLRLTEALKAHLAASADSESKFKEMKQKLDALQSEDATNRMLVREQIVSNKASSQNIKDLEYKIPLLESALEYAVQEFDKQRGVLRHDAQKEIDQLKRVAAMLKLNLERKAQEMNHIRRLANHVLKQRTEVERFFIDALDYVRKNVKEKASKTIGTDYDILSWADKENVLRALFARMNGLIK